MGAIISFFRPAPTTQGAWSQQELAEFYRVEAALLRAGMRITCEQGLSDEDDPWFVFCRPNGDVIMHFARIDGSYVIASEALDQPMRGPDFRSLLNQIAAQYPTLLPIPRAEPGAKLVVHPAALLTAIIAAAALSLSPDEAFASGIAPAEADGSVPPPSPGGPGEPPSQMAEERGAEAHEQGDHRRQIEAIVFSAMLFAAQTASVDDLGPRTNPELSATKLTSHTADQAAHGDLALPPVPAAGSGRAPDPAAQSAPSPAPALERQAHKDATPSGAEHVSVIQQSRPDFGFEGPDFPKLPVADHPAGLKLDGARYVRSAETGHPRSASERASTDHRPAETASAQDGSAEVKQTSAAPASPPAAPAPVAATTAVSTPAGSTEEAGSKVQQSAAQTALQVTAEASAASELRFDTARVLPRPDLKPVETKAPATPAPEAGPAAGPGIETSGPARVDVSAAASPVRIEADAADGTASHPGRSQSPAADRSEPLLRVASDLSGAEGRGTKAEGTLAAVGLKGGEAGANPAGVPVAGESSSGTESSRPVEALKAQKVAGSDAPATTDGSPGRSGIESAKAEVSTPSAGHTASGKDVASSPGHGPAVDSVTAVGAGAGDPGSKGNAATAVIQAAAEAKAPEAASLPVVAVTAQAGAEAKAPEAASLPAVAISASQTIAGSDQSRGETTNAAAHHTPSGDLTPPAETPATVVASPPAPDATGTKAQAPATSAAAPDASQSTPSGTSQAHDGTGAKNQPGPDASAALPGKASAEITGTGQSPAGDAASGPSPIPAADGAAPVANQGHQGPTEHSAPAASTNAGTEVKAPEAAPPPTDTAASGQSQAALAPETAPSTTGAVTSPSQANGTGADQSPSVVASSPPVDTAPSSSPTPGTDKPAAAAAATTPGQESAEVPASGASQPHPEGNSSVQEPPPATGGTASADASGSSSHAPTTVTSAVPSETSTEAGAPEASHPPAGSAAPGPSHDATGSNPAPAESLGPAGHGAVAPPAAASHETSPPESLSPQHGPASDPGHSTPASTPEVATSAGPDHTGPGTHTAQVSVSPSPTGQASPETGAAATDTSPAGTVSGAQDGTIVGPAPVQETSPGGHAPGDPSATGTLPPTSSTTSPEAGAPETGSSRAEPAGAGAEHGHAGPSHPAEPGAATAPPSVTGSTPPVTPSSGTPSSSTAGAQNDPAPNGNSVAAQPAPLRAAVGPDGTLVFPGDTKAPGSAEPNHGPHDADLHPDVSVTGIAHDHGLPHHVDWH
ncbi:hypothetical protein [Methylobacterium oryzisoli]|uniref:hypothetical protein n=1 Tax=Methylobacterium oryzisoli TaxID=3385502 RepID=UPI0038913ADB